MRPTTKGMLTGKRSKDGGQPFGLYTSMKSRLYSLMCRYAGANRTLNSLLCFHMGRPSSLTADDIGTVYPEDPFLLALIHLSKAISRSAKEIYGKRHQSLLQMWKVALSISDGLSGYECRMRKAVGFGLEKTPQPGHIGVQQTVLALCKWTDIS